MSDEQDQQQEDEQEQKGTGVYNPSGGIPSHYADPGYGSGAADDKQGKSA